MVLFTFLIVFSLNAGDLKNSPPDTLNWIGHWENNDLRDTLVREVYREFMYVNQNVKVNLKFPREILGVRSKPLMARYIADMIRKGGSPQWDIIWMDDMIYQHVSRELNDPLWGQKYLLNFGAIDGFLQSHKSFVLDDPQYRQQTGNVHVGPYIEGYYYCIWYNASLAKKIGLQIKERGVTFDEFLSYLKKIDEYNKKNRSAIAALYACIDNCRTDVLFQSLFKSLLKNFQDAKSEVFTKEKKDALLVTLKAFEKMGYYKPLISTYKKNIWIKTRDQILDDKVVFYIHGTWMYNLFREIDKEKFTEKIRIMETPVFNPVNYTQGGFVPAWAVMKNSANTENAIKMMLFWCRPKIAEKWINYTKNPTAIKGNLSSPVFAEDIYERFQAYMSQSYGNRIHYSLTTGYILGKSNDNLSDFFNDCLHQLLEGTQTADQIYRKVLEKTDQ